MSRKFLYTKSYTFDTMRTIICNVLLYEKEIGNLDGKKQ